MNSEIEVWNLFRKIFDSTFPPLDFESLTGLESFLEKVPHFLEKFPDSFMGRGQESKIRFRFWFLYRVLIIPSFSQSPNVKALSSKISKILLNSLNYKEPSSFHQLIHHYIKFITDLLIFLEKNESPLIISPQFGPIFLDVSKDKIYPHFESTNYTLEFVESNQLETFISEIVAMISDFHSAIIPSNDNLSALLRGIQISDWPLKSSLILFISQFSFPLHLLPHLYDMMFSIIMHIITNGITEFSNTQLYSSLQRLFVLQITSIEEKIQEKLYCQHSLFFWNKLLDFSSFNISIFQSFPSDLKSVLYKSLKYSMSWDLSKIVDFILKFDFCIEASEILGTLISHEIHPSYKRKHDSDTPIVSSSSTWKKIEELMTLSLKKDESLETSLVFTSILSNTSNAAKFLTVDLISEILQCLLESVIHDESSVLNVMLVMENLCSIPNICWPNDSLPLLLVSLPWKCFDFSPLEDLKVGKNLWNRIRALHIPQNENVHRKCIKILMTLPSKISPKWRLGALTFLWSQIPFRPILLSHLLVFYHHFGSLAESFVEEILYDTLRNGSSECNVILSRDIIPHYLCVKAKKFQLPDSYCSSCSKDRKESTVSFETEKESQFLVKFIGFGENEIIRNNILRLIRPWSLHLGFHENISLLWLNVLENSSQFPFYIKYLLHEDNNNNKKILTAIQEMKHRVSSDILIRVWIQIAHHSSTSNHEIITGELIDFYLSQDSHICAFNFAIDYLRSQIPIYKSLLMTVFSQRLLEEKNDVLNAMTVLFRSSKASNFLSQNMHHILPHFVLANSKSGIEFLSEMVSSSSRYLLAENFQSIFPAIVVGAKDSKSYSETVKFLENLTKVPLKDLLLSKRQRITTELILHFHAHAKRVITAFQWLSSTDITESKQGTSNSIVRYIQPKFLGVLGFIDRRLSNPNIPQESKKETLLSLVDVLEYMGADALHSVKHNLISLFNTGAHNASNRNVYDALLNCWKVFIKVMSPISLAPILPEIVAHLVDLFRPESNESNLIDIFHVLIKDPSFHSQFYRLNFLPDLPPLSEINGYIMKMNKLQDLPFKDVLILVTNSLSTKNLQVKLQTLKKLKALLRLNQSQVQGLIASSDTVDPFMANLVISLVDGTRTDSLELCSFYGECLGEIGAIDPGRLHLVQNFNGSLERECHMNISDDRSFAADLIHVLCLAFLNSSDSDSCAFSIQEVLKIYGSQILEELPKETTTAEVVTPFLTSLYSRKEDSKISYSLPIFQHSSSFESWITNWSCYLISRIQDGKVRNLFNVCKPALRKDLPTSKYLLPYIVIHVLAKNDTHDITREFNAIIHSECNDDFKSKALCILFNIQDHLRMWCRKRYCLLTDHLKRSDDHGKATSQDFEYMSILKFLNSIDSEAMAKASFHNHAYARALIHYEHFLQMKNNIGENREDLFTLQRLYQVLEEPDCVLGVARLRRYNPSLEELISQHEATGNYSDALACYESQCAEKNQKPPPGMIKCYLETERTHTAFYLGEGCKEQLEAAWELGQWSVISKTESNYESQREKSWESYLSHVMLSIQQSNSSQFYEVLTLARKDVMRFISAVANEQGSYQRSYSHIVKLQMLNECELISEALIFSSSFSSTESLLDTLWARLSYAQYSLSSLESVLKLRRALFKLALDRQFSPELENQLGALWLHSAKIARKCNQLEKSYALLTEASKFKLRSAFLETAKLCWARNDRGESISVLKKGLLEYYPEVNMNNYKHLNEQDRDLFGDAKLLLTRYLDENDSVEKESLPNLFTEARLVKPNSEKAFYYHAKFYDKVLGRSFRETDLDMQGEVVYHIIALYGRSLNHGCYYLQMSLPRILSLWFDYGSRVISHKSSSHGDMIAILDKLNAIMEKFIALWPSYYFLSVFPQLTSRICHAHPVVWNILKTIMVKTFCAHPEHVLWHMVSLSNSSFKTRVYRCKEIFEMVRNSKNMAQYVDDGLKLTDLLLKLTDAPIKKPGIVSLKKILPSLPKLLESSNFSRIMMPTTFNCTMMLPTSSQVSLKSKHNPFPSGLVTFSTVEDSVTIMQSLVKPKKVTFLASNGKRIAFLLKPKDDLRRDCRLIDFNNLLNKLFMKDPSSRQRDLHIRTYTVFPLNEVNGIIEWLENVVLLREILTKLYKEKLGVRSALTRDEHERFSTSPTDVEKNKKTFQILIERFPPIFSQWFIQNFPDPQAWYLSRLAYVRTTAVMSMVCYVFALGDRHAENIMFDSSNGDTVHVDLNCLFNKGETLYIPETVPFRLTHNMVEAMGPLGVEGPFRIACEVSLHLMREQRDILMSTLRPFYFDPLVDWIHGDSRKSKSNDTGEVMNEKAVEALTKVQNRLDGFVEGKKKSAKSSSLRMPLSVPGQVNYLIQEATSVDNLSQMYLGWASYY